jgi:hypothetical protein
MTASLTMNGYGMAFAGLGGTLKLLLLNRSLETSKNVNSG